MSKDVDITGLSIHTLSAAHQRWVSTSSVPPWLSCPSFSAKVFADPSDVFYDIVVENVRVAPDGFPRDAIQAGAFPGQLIIANKGDVLHLNVTNKLTNPTMRRSTSIARHISGSHSNRGRVRLLRDVSIVSLTPNNSAQRLIDLALSLNFPLLGQTGTYWFHSHLSTQYIDGERGTLVIYGMQTKLIKCDFLPSHLNEPVPDSGLIKGVGRYVGGPAIPSAVVNGIKGKKYRFWVINIAGYAAFTFFIDGHTFDVIETDGIATEPLTVTSFLIHAAQRYSVVLRADVDVGNYWIRAPMSWY
ncbi:Cupredoxin [Mycena epipterygia]|nr:Cupredoxin [Mycena epipterygia]